MNSLTSIEALQRAIALVAAEQLDYKKIVVQLAQHYPETFVKLATNSMCQQWHRTVRQYLIEGGSRVAAVKLVREKTGLGLKEALDVCHVAQNILFSLGKTSEAYNAPSDFHIDEKSKVIADSIAYAD